METKGDNGGARSGAPLFIPVWAGLAGAAGVGLSAAAAHKVDSPALAIAATMLTLHAAAAIGIFAIAFHSGRPKLWGVAALVMLFSTSLFSGEIALHTFSGNASLQLLAPVGGSGMIVSWLLLAMAGVAEVLGRR